MAKDKSQRITYITERMNEIFEASKNDAALEDLSHLESEFDIQTQPNNSLSSGSSPIDGTGASSQTSSTLSAQQLQQATQVFDGKPHLAQVVEDILHDPQTEHIYSNSEISREHIAEKIADLIDKVADYADKNNPYANEREAFNSYSQYRNKRFQDSASNLLNSLSKVYSSSQLNIDFYAKEFADNDAASSNFSLCKDEFLKDWNRELTIKEIDYELSVLNAMKKNQEYYFRDKLYDFEQLMNEPHFDSAIAQLFWSYESGNWSKYTFDVFKKYALLFRNNKSLHKLVSMLGRDELSEGMESLIVKKIIANKQFSRSQKSDIVGITENGDLSSLLPIELASLSDKHLENNFYKRYTEKKLQTFSYQSHTTKYIHTPEVYKKLHDEKHGPFIVCIDTSGSMRGTPEEVVKTVCYGLINKSQEQKRNCFVISFSTEIEVLDISLLKQNSKKIIEFLCHSFHGGTDLTPAMKKSLEMLTDERYKNADVLFISDFDACDFSDDTIKKIKSAMKNGTKFHSLLIGKCGNKNLINVFDMNWTYNSGKVTLKNG